MIKINLNQSRKSANKWLPKNQYSAYATALISSNLNKDSALDDDGIQNIRDVIDNHLSGATTAKGYSVSVRYLLGAINQISPELADALTSSKSESTESEFF